MTSVDYVLLTLNVPSIEDTVAWYERVLGWKGHYDVFDESGHCTFGSVMLREDPFKGFNLSRASETMVQGGCPHCAAWIYTDNVDAVYLRVLENGWTTETTPANQFWGDRTFSLRDVNGFQLIFAQQVESLDLEAIRQRQQRLLREKQTGENENPH